MKPTQIYGLLLVQGHSAVSAGVLLGVSESLVREVIWNRRAAGPDARRVRAWLAATLGLPEGQIWPAADAEATDAAA